MPRKVRVATTSWFNLPGDRNIEANRRQACNFIEAAASEGADLVCLPENFLHTGIPEDQLPWAETVPGATFDALSRLARQYEIWVVASYCVHTDDGTIENSALVIDRAGNLAGRYAKVHPTVGEIEDRRIVPGSHATVVDTDFGRIGLAICYDIGWPDLWAQLGEQGAEVVIWPSAYDGGFPLRAYAWTHFYYVVSSVRSQHSRVIDVSGRILTSTSNWHRITTTTIDLEKEVFHIDFNVDKFARIQRDFGDRVTITGFSEENIFTLESNDPEWPVARIKQEYGLENHREYHADATHAQELHQRMVPTPAQR